MSKLPHFLSKAKTQMVFQAKNVSFELGPWMVLRFAAPSSSWSDPLTATCLSHSIAGGLAWSTTSTWHLGHNSIGLGLKLFFYGRILLNGFSVLSVLSNEN